MEKRRKISCTLTFDLMKIETVGIKGYLLLGVSVQATSFSPLLRDYPNCTSVMYTLFLLFVHLPFMAFPSKIFPCLCHSGGKRPYLATKEWHIPLKMLKFKEDDKKHIIVGDSLFDNETELADNLQKETTAPLQPQIHCKQWANAPLKEWLNYLNHCRFK